MSPRSVQSKRGYYKLNIDYWLLNIGYLSINIQNSIDITSLALLRPVIDKQNVMSYTHRNLHFHHFRKMTHICRMKRYFSNTAIGRLRFIGITEGISFLLLLFIAMPLKYFADLPEAVKYTGWIHGLLFMAYLVALLHVKIVQQWSIKKVTIAFLASLIPFGTFVLDSEWRKEERLVLAPATNK